MSLIKLFLKLPIISLVFGSCSAQIPSDRAHCANAEFDAKVTSMLSFNVNTVSVSALKNTPNVFLIDTRSEKEFEVSHIDGAHFLNYANPNFQALSALSKDIPIVVYCSIGYRSEKMAKKLQRMGFTNVKNLFGSIFEWVNAGNPVVDGSSKYVNRIHTYNHRWSKWVYAPIEKVW